MMPTSLDSLFYLAFLGQIFVISWYFPNKVLRRMTYVLETFPPSTYPRLYPMPVEYYRIGRWAFRAANRFVAVLGLGLMLVMLFVVDHGNFADDGFISEAWPAAFGILQFLPFMALEFSEFGQFRLMRKANASTTRTAQLKRRVLFDYVSPALLGLAGLLFAGYVLLDLYVHQFEIRWGQDALQRMLVFAVTNLLLAGVGAFNLYGRKCNPHQSSEDRARQTSANLHSLVYVSMAMSVFFMTEAVDDMYDLAFLDATLMSLYFQVIVAVSLGHVLRSVRLSEVNFDVYRNGDEAVI